MAWPTSGGQLDPSRPGRVRSRLGVELPSLGWLTLVVLIAAAFAVIASRPSAPVVNPPTGDAARAERAISALLDPRSGRDPLAELPADFTAVINHTPGRMPAPDGTIRAVHVAGGCSSPWGDDNTRWDYGVGCKAHDLGYDLLRYADAKGQPLDPALRKRLDDQLSADMHATCGINPRGSAGLCQIVAALYSVGLVVNSWHQRWGPPRTEPIGPWTIGLVVIALLIAARAPALTGRPRRRPPQPAAPEPSPVLRAQSDYLGFLRILSLTGIVLAESVLALAHWGPAEPAWAWPLTWLLQLVPLLFLAGGHATLLAWRATVACGGGFGHYLAGQIGWLLRPVLAFVTAWLVVPLSLELLEAPEAAIAAFGRIVLQPLWLLGLYLLVVAATPVMHWLHRRLPLATPLALLTAVLTIGVAGRGSVAAHAGGILVALLFAQLAFHYADGTLWRLRRPTLIMTALAGFTGLVALTLGGLPRLLIAEPTAYASFIPSLIGVLLIGLVQVCLVALPRARGAQALAGSAPARAVAVLRDAPVTAYLVFLCAMLLVAGVIGAARTAGLPTTGVDWLTQPRTMLALALVGVPTMLAFLLFERKSTAPDVPHPEPEPDPPGPPAPQLDAVAAAIGVVYGALGLLGFAVSGITGASQPPILFGLPLDPIANLIHLLLGWYLVHCVRIQTSARPWPWLLTAIACVPPMITTVSGAGFAVHGGTMLVALAIAAWRSQPAVLVRTRSRPVPEVTR